MRAISAIVFGYLRSVLYDVHDTFARGLEGRSGLASILLFLIPWAALPALRDNLDWLPSLTEIVLFAVAFWWMSRAGAPPGATVTKPAVESLFAILLIALWVEWRAVICSRTLFFLPGDFNCYGNLVFEMVPKLLEMTVFPFLVLLLAGYGLRAQGVHWSWRAWWIALPALLGLVAYGVYTHWQQPREFVQSIWNFALGAGLPEEFLFRAVLLTRLETWWRNPGWALYGAAIFFGLSHLAIDYLVFTKQDWRETWITVLTFQMGFGFAFGFAYQRMRNIWPLVLLHAVIDAL